MKNVVIIAGAIMIAISVYFTTQDPAGLFGVAVGIGLILYGRIGKKREQVEAMQETVKQDIIRTVSTPAARPRRERRETIKVAGISHYTDAVLSLGVENPAYKYTKDAIVEAGLDGEEIPKYIFRVMDDVQFVPEPNNQYDSNAIAIYVEGKKIGHVPASEAVRIRKLFDDGKVAGASCQIVGGRYKIYYSDTGDLDHDNLNYGARITMRIYE